MDKFHLNSQIYRTVVHFNAPIVTDDVYIISQTIVR